MLNYCLVCKKNTENKDVKMIKAKNIMKKQEAKVLLSNLGIKKPLSKVPLLGDLLF